MKLNTRNIYQGDGVQISARGIVMEAAMENKNDEGAKISELTTVTSNYKEKQNDNGIEYHGPIKICECGTWENDVFVNESALTTGKNITVVAKELKNQNTFAWQEEQASDNDREYAEPIQIIGSGTW